MEQKVILNYDSVIELKNVVKKYYADKIHFHDACGGQYFSLEVKNEKLLAFIKEYFEQKNIKAVLSEDGLTFSLQK